MNYTTGCRRLLLHRLPRACGRPRCLSTKYDPLRILFCGADQYSIASLNALYAEHIRSPDSIASIDVVCRPAKRVGRGLKTLQEVPIKSAATKLSLPIHEIDTFTGWTPPQPHGAPIDLVVAVSFGLFVPPRILNGTKYGGLNVHPSLLPDFYGAAPLHRTLMAGEKRTGITLQTLHAQKFDSGVILDQRELDIPDPDNSDVPRLLSLVSEPSGQLLVNGIRNRLFEPPVKPVVRPSTGNGRHQRHAAKITSEDRRPDWSTWGWEQIRRHQQIIGPLRNKAIPAADTDPKHRWRIMRFIEMRLAKPEDVDRTPRIQPGLPFLDVKSASAAEHYDNKTLYIWTCDGQLVQIAQVQLDGERSGPAYRVALKARLIGCPKSGESLCEFHNPLQ